MDFDLVNEGGRTFRRFGRTVADVLLQLALIGSYRFGGASDLLVATGALTGTKTRRRLAETQHWATTLSGHDALRRPGAGFRLTVHVRLMHALVNHRFETHGRWDVGRWGLPINRSDLAATLGLFNAVSLLLGEDRFEHRGSVNGNPVSTELRDAPAEFIELTYEDIA